MVLWPERIVVMKDILLEAKVILMYHIFFYMLYMAILSIYEFAFRSLALRMFVCFDFFSILSAIFTPKTNYHAFKTKIDSVLKVYTKG